MDRLAYNMRTFCCQFLPKLKLLSANQFHPVVHFGCQGTACPVQSDCSLLSLLRFMKPRSVYRSCEDTTRVQQLLPLAIWNVSSWFHAGQLGAIQPVYFSRGIKNLTCCINTADLNVLEVVKLGRQQHGSPASWSALKVCSSDLRSGLRCWTCIILNKSDFYFFCPLL